MRCARHYAEAQHGPNETLGDMNTGIFLAGVIILLLNMHAVFDVLIPGFAENRQVNVQHGLHDMLTGLCRLWIRLDIVRINGQNLLRLGMICGGSDGRGNDDNCGMGRSSLVLLRVKPRASGIPRSYVLDVR